MRTDLRYAATGCFETFPFPKADPRTIIPELEAIGAKLYESRAKYMVDANQGLTKTYNALKDPSCTDERILALRELHEEMDRAVLRAYPRLPQQGVDSNRSPGSAATTSGAEVIGWSDIPVPPFCIATDENKAALQAFEDEVLDRLFVLNEVRAKEEAGRSNATSQRKKKAPTRQPKKPPRPRSPDGSEQDDLF